MSALEIGGRRYACQPMREYQESGMSAYKLSYEYDCGSTTELVLRVVGCREHGTRRGAVELLARNDPPGVTCQRCGAQPATQLCTECVWNGNGWMCQACAKRHECGTEMCLPAVNSPRAGVCGYTG